jgi:hypothetical protein
MVAGYGRRVSALVLLGLLIFPFAGGAQKKQKLAKNYREWLEQEVVYIITKEERENFLKLATATNSSNAFGKFATQIPVHPQTNSRKSTTSGLRLPTPDSV